MGANKVPGHCRLFLRTMTHYFLLPLSFVRPWTQGCREGGEEKEGRRNKSRISTDGTVGYLVRVTVYLTGSDPSSLCPPTQTPNIHCDDMCSLTVKHVYLLCWNDLRQNDKHLQGFVATLKSPSTFSSAWYWIILL